MLPPIDEAVLQCHPKFAALHATLANNILNPSGSTKRQAAQKERDAVSESLKTALLRAARTQLIRNALNSLDLNPETPSTNTKTRLNRNPPAKQHQLPPDLVELILLLSARLSSHAPTHALLESSPQWSSLYSALPSLAALLSTTLHAQALALCRIQSPTSNPSFLHRSIPKLVPHAEEALSTHASTKTALAVRRSALIATATVLMDAYHLATVFVIQTLESVSCGAVARHSRARADFWALRARELGLEALEKESGANGAIYTAPVCGALENYMAALRDGRERLRERERGAERALWGYGRGREDGEKERVMREIARVYGELGREMEDVGRDVGRLKGGRVGRR